jgi:hypothetical protein
MFKKLQNKTKKALKEVRALFKTLGEIVGEIVDGITDIDFD